MCNYISAKYGIHISMAMNITVNEYKYYFLIFVALINKGVSEVHIIAEKVELQSEKHLLQ